MTDTCGTSVDVIRGYRYSKMRQRSRRKTFIDAAFPADLSLIFVDGTRLLRKNSRALTVRSTDLFKLSEPAMHDW